MRVMIDLGIKIRGLRHVGRVGHEQVHGPIPVRQSIVGRGVSLDDLYPGVTGIGLGVGQGGVGKLHCLHLRLR